MIPSNGISFTNENSFNHNWSTYIHVYIQYATVNEKKGHTTSVTYSVLSIIQGNGGKGVYK
jgi:hypothetical protein